MLLIIDFFKIIQTSWETIKYYLYMTVLHTYKI